MKKIAIISSSVRDGRLSHRAALYLRKYIADTTGSDTDLIDLLEYDFPVFHERLSMQANPDDTTLDFAARIVSADGVVIVSPVYNASFPAALKNVIDLLYGEWRRKPVLIVSVTYGNVPGIATVRELQNLFLKLESRVATGVYTVIRAGTEFSEDGVAVDPDSAAKYAAGPVKEFMWLVENSLEIK